MANAPIRNENDINEHFNKFLKYKRNFQLSSLKLDG